MTTEQNKTYSIMERLMTEMTKHLQSKHSFPAARHATLFRYINTFSLDALVAYAL